jgi:hypothetical protein
MPKPKLTTLPVGYSLLEGEKFEHWSTGMTIPDEYYVGAASAAPDSLIKFKSVWWDLVENRVKMFTGTDSSGDPQWKDAPPGTPKIVVDLKSGEMLGRIVSTTVNTMAPEHVEESPVQSYEDFLEQARKVVGR